MLLVGCGGGGAIPVPAQFLPSVLVQASDKIVSTAGYALSIFPTDEPDPVRSVRQQALQRGPLMLWPGNIKRDGFARFTQYVDAAALNPAFKSVYIFDEWCFSEKLYAAHGDGFGDCRELEIMAAARYARAHGLKAAVSIIPAVVLHPQFKPLDINAFDVIGLDIYPSLPLGNYECAITGNPYTALLACAIARLRSLGFQGEIYYITQAFGINTQPLADTLAQLALQRETIAAAPGLGVTMLAPWGQYMSAADIALEPALYQGRGSAIESKLGLP